MPIGLKQYKKVYDKFFLEVLKEGRIPTIDEVNQRAGDYLPNVTSAAAPIAKYKPQKRDSVFDRLLYNKFVDQVKLDLEILFDELEEVELKNIQRILHADLFHAVNSYELKRLDMKLDSLLFATGAFDEGFFVQFEDFSDFAKTNQQESTPGMLNTEENCLALPIGAAGAQKLDTSHLYNLSTPTLEVTPATATVVGVIPGSLFGNNFKDSINSWGVEVHSPTNDKVKIAFKFRLAREEFINRVTLIPHGETAQKAYISYSVDDENIKSWPEYTAGISLMDQSTIYSLDVDNSLAEFIYVELEKDQADEEISDGGSSVFKYIFGLKNISVYMTGRLESGSYVSKPFDFSEELSAIGKVALTTKESLPENTEVNWFIAFADEEGNVSGSFIPIMPQNRNIPSGLPKVLNIAEVLTNVKDFTVAIPTKVFDYNSIDFYRLTTLETQPVFGTAQLFRGFDAWTRDKKGTPISHTVKDNWLPFSLGDTQTLYTLRTETQNIVLVNSNGILILSTAPLYDSDNHSLTAFSAGGGEGVSVNVDTTPEYAIYYTKVAPTSITGLSFTDTSDLDTGTYDFNTGAILDHTVKVEKYDVDDVLMQTYVNGNTVGAGSTVADFQVSLGDGGYPDGLILVVTGSNLDQTPLGSGEYYKLSCDFDLDISRYVSSIEGPQITFRTEMGPVFNGRAVDIKYRSVPTDVVKASLKAKKMFGPVSQGSDIYKQGIDYIFDVSTSKIQRLATGSIPGGANEGSDVFCDFIWHEESPIEAYSIWAHVGNEAGVSIKLENMQSGTGTTIDNGLHADTEKGEFFKANIPGVGLIDITGLLEWPHMSGWVQFFVASLNPFVEDSEGNEDQSQKATQSSQTGGTEPLGLIDKVINLKDINLNRIFNSGGGQFTELIANRQPLQQVSLPFLKNNVLKDQIGFFAVDKVIVNQISIYNILVNFTQNTNINLYNYSPNLEDSSSIGNVLKHDETFRLKWINQEIENAFTKIIVKTTLKRSTASDIADVNSNITPKVFNYFLKTGY